MLDLANVVVVLLREDLLVMHRLNGVVIVVLVDLAVNSSVHLLMLLRSDCLMLNRRLDMLMDSCVVVSSFGHELGDSFLSLIHCE